MIEVTQAFCTNCRQDQAVEKLASGDVEFGLTSARRYRCAGCRFVSGVFYIEPKFYLGEGLPDDLAVLAR